MGLSISSEIIRARVSHLKVNDTVAENCANFSLEEAYRIQKLIIKGCDDEVVAWKLGGTNFKTRESFKVDKPYWGPIFRNNFFIQTNDVEEYQIPKDYCCEVEVALRLSRDVTEKNYATDRNPDMGTYIDKVAISTEYPWSVFDNPAKYGVGALVSDACATGFAVIGQQKNYAGFKSEDFDVSINLNGNMVAQGGISNLVGSLPLILDQFVFSSLSMGFNLKKGQWILTGGITPCIRFREGNEITIKSKGFNKIKFKGVSIDA